MKNSELVSVIVPTYNRSGMLKRAVASVLGQTHQHFEIIIIADGCNDDTKSVIEQFEDKRIRSIIVHENVGGAQARNIGIDAAKGNYIAFLDDDDEWVSEKVSKQIEAFQKYADTAIVSTNHFVAECERQIAQKRDEVVRLQDLLFENLCGSFSFCMTKREHINGLRINPLLRAAQDWDLWVKILSVTGLNCRVIQNPLVIYHQGHQDRLSNNQTDVLKAIILFLRNHWDKMTDEHKYYQLYEYLKHYRKTTYNDLGYIIRLRTYIKALRYYHKSNYNQNLYNYLLLLTKIINYS